MNAQPSGLFEAFKEDHAVLGRGLHEISKHLRGGDFVAAKACSQSLDRDAGAHIAFEEKFFYPALRGLLGDADVDRLYDEHRQGLGVIKALAELAPGSAPSEARRRAMLEGAELMEAHVAECGELFGAMGRVPIEEQNRLHLELLALRKQSPAWTEVART